MKHEERKIKAIEIMEKMDIYKPYIKGFRESDKVCFFERFGGYWVDQEPEIYNKMKEIEKEYFYRRSPLWMPIRNGWLFNLVFGHSSLL